MGLRNWRPAGVVAGNWAAGTGRPAWRGVPWSCSYRVCPAGGQALFIHHVVTCADMI